MRTCYQKLNTTGSVDFIGNTGLIATVTNSACKATKSGDTISTLSAMTVLINYRRIEMRAILKAACNIDELYATLENISADDHKEFEDYTDAEIVHEAEYVLSTFHEAGHINGDALSGESEDDPCNQKWAQGEVRKLKALIKKFK
jgi:hypothetical protein